ncbi:MAG: ribonuclease HII [Patescibacteria group bacterium]
MQFQEITQFERNLHSKGIRYIAGVDEVGRGPLAGPFVVSAVILDLDKILSEEFEYIINDIQYIKKGSQEWCYTQINDSKLVSPKKRDKLANFIKKEAISYSIVSLSSKEVDKLGISEVTQVAFFSAIKNLKIKPEKVFTDTFEIKKLTREDQINIISGDRKSISVAAASIVAKVYRDNIMIEEHAKYPVYGFDRHKGYGTRYHLDSLRKYGPCEIHRKSFNPVKTTLRIT